MRRLFIGVLSFTLLALPGCPQPEDPLAADAAQNGGATPGSPGNPPQANPDGSTNPAPPDGSTPGAGAPFKPAGFASLITDGKTVTITGKLIGAQTAQIDFTAIKEVEGTATPEVIEIVNATDGTFTVTAPATYDREIYVTAVSTQADKGPSPEDPGGMAAAPIKLAGVDVTVEVTVSKDPDWMKKLPWYREGAPLPPDAGALEGGGAGGVPAPPPTPGADGSTPSAVPGTQATPPAAGTPPAGGAPAPAAPAAAPPG